MSKEIFNAHRVTATTFAMGTGKGVGLEIVAENVWEDDSIIRIPWWLALDLAHAILRHRDERIGTP